MTDLATGENRIPDSTGKRIRAARLDRGWSQQELGSRARLSISTINGVETGADIRLATLHAIALALDLPASDLIVNRRAS